MQFIKKDPASTSKCTATPNTDRTNLPPSDQVCIIPRAVPNEPKNTMNQLTLGRRFPHRSDRPF